MIPKLCPLCKNALVSHKMISRVGYIYNCCNQECIAWPLDAPRATTFYIETYDDQVIFYQSYHYINNQLFVIRGTNGNHYLQDSSTIIHDCYGRELFELDYFIEYPNENTIEFFQNITNRFLNLRAFL